MNAGIGRFVMLSVLVHAGLLLAWGAPDPAEPRYAGGPPLRLALRAPAPATPPSPSPATAAPEPDAAEPEASETVAPEPATRRSAAQRPAAEPAEPAAKKPAQEAAREPVQKPGRQPDRTTHRPATGEANVSETPRSPPQSPPRSGSPRDSRLPDRPRLSDHEVTNRIRTAFATHFRYPRLAQRKGWEGRVRVGLHVAADGRLTGIRVLKSSGHRVLDQAAVRTLGRVSDIPDVEDRIHRSGMDIVLPIEYRLVDA